MTWSTYKGDFFPYGGQYDGHYWTGYFSSRPNFKKYIRDYTGLAETTDTLVGIETLKNRTKSS